jgi:hypothetical protein
MRFADITTVQCTLRDAKHASAYAVCGALSRCESMSELPAVLAFAQSAAAQYRECIVAMPLLETMDSTLYHGFRRCLDFDDIYGTMTDVDPTAGATEVLEAVEAMLNALFAAMVIPDAVYAELDAALAREHQLMACNVVQATLNARRDGMTAAQIMTMVGFLTGTVPDVTPAQLADALIGKK